jgi:hypothetical protein
MKKPTLRDLRRLMTDTMSLGSVKGRIPLVSEITSQVRHYERYRGADDIIGKFYWQSHAKYVKLKAEHDERVAEKQVAVRPAISGKDYRQRG